MGYKAIWWNLSKNAYILQLQSEFAVFQMHVLHNAGNLRHFTSPGHKVEKFAFAIQLIPFHVHVHRKNGKQSKARCAQNNRSKEKSESAHFASNYSAKFCLLGRVWKACQLDVVVRWDYALNGSAMESLKMHRLII